MSSPENARIDRARDPSSAEAPAERFDPGRVVRTCPNCSATLQESRCKLCCPRCHYYMSCSDY